MTVVILNKGLETIKMECWSVLLTYLHHSQFIITRDEKPKKYIKNLRRDNRKTSLRFPNDIFYGFFSFLPQKNIDK
jgi:hypothetical protein